MIAIVIQKLSLLADNQWHHFVSTPFFAFFI